MAHGLRVPGLGGRPGRPVHLSRRLFDQDGALTSGGRGDVVLHPLRERPYESVYPAVARRQAVDRQHETQLRAGQTARQLFVQGFPAAAAFQQSDQRHKLGG